MQLYMAGPTVVTEQPCLLVGACKRSAGGSGYSFRLCFVARGIFALHSRIEMSPLGLFRLPFSQAHAWATTVLVDEFHAGRL